MIAGPVLPLYICFLIYCSQETHAIGVLACGLDQESKVEAENLPKVTQLEKAGNKFKQKFVCLQRPPFHHRCLPS